MMHKNYDYFLTIAKMGSLTKAAEALYITQSSLSKYLSRLEESLNIQLFDRSRSPLVLTYAGRLYLDYVNSVLALDSSLQERFDEIRSDDRGEITFGITSWRSSIMLPTLLPLFRKRHPHIRVNVLEGRSYTFESAMLNNQVDFCLMSVPSNFSMATKYESLGMEKIYLAGNRSHPAVEKALSGPAGPDGIHRFDPQWLNGESFINLKPGQVLCRVNQQFLARYDLHPRELWSTENTVTAMNLVDHTPCFTTVPALCTRMDYLPPNMVLMELGDPPLEWEMAIVYPKHTRITRIMRLFIDTVKELYHNDPLVRRQYSERISAEMGLGEEPHERKC